jgi:ADP-heptose:LPS heptosyltransferase
MAIGTKDGPILLIFRDLGLGDFLTGVPAYRALRRHFVDHEIVLAARPRLTELAVLSGAIDRVIIAAGPSWAGQPGRGVDVAVNLHGRGPQSYEALMRLAPRRIIAFQPPHRSAEPLPTWYADEHEVVRWCRLLVESGIPADPSDLLLDSPVAVPVAEDAVLIHPGAAFGSRRWPAQRFAVVARWLHERGWNVLLTGSETERPLAESIAGAAGLPTTAVTAGTLSLTELAATVQHARLVLSGDTGVAHLATAFRTPPHQWGPPPSGPHAALWRGSRVGNPWGALPDPALLALTIEDVIAAVDHQLGATTRA